MVKQLLFAYYILFSTIGYSYKTMEDLSKCSNCPSISFTENKGQVSDQNFKPRPDILYGGVANGMAFHLRNNGISYQLFKIDSHKELKEIKANGNNHVIDKSTCYRIDVNWLNCNTSSQIIKSKALSGNNHYYLEVCPDGTKNVNSYEELTYKNIYKNINLKWYQKNGCLKYDYIVKAGADYKQILLEINGVEKISLNTKGELELTTPLGNIIEQAPIVYQHGKILKSKWLLKNISLSKFIISFDIDDVNPNEDFIIDPAIRTWGTYYGANGTDQGLTTSKDINGNVYIGGQTSSNTSTLIATIGAHQTAYAGGLCDAYIVKFDSAGVRQWSAYYGGAGEENGASCAADALGNVYLTGFTNSGTGNVIATLGSHQYVYGNGGYDSYLVKFNSLGIRQWGTYYGGNLVDYGNSCATDASGNVYLAGYTGTGPGTDIATLGSHQAVLGGSYDAFLVKFNTNGVRQWGTYYGDTGNDYAMSVCSTGGDVFITGYTEANTGTIIATLGSHQPTNGGVYDAFLVKFNSSGVRQWGTYYGGSGDDQSYSCSGDALGNVFIAGYTSTSSGTSIASNTSHQAVFGGGYDAFLSKFNSLGQRLWGTYYGGTGNDYANGCTTDISGNSFLAGYTGSNTGTVIATPGSYQAIYGGGSNDAFLTKFDKAGVRQWGTYYGGAATEIGYACSTNDNNIVYLTGNTNSAGGSDIATIGSHQSTYGTGLTDAFLVQFYDCIIPQAPINASPVDNLTICANNSTTLFATGTGTINWYATPTSTNVLFVGGAFITPTLSIGTYSFYSETQTCTNSATRTEIVVTVEVCTNLQSNNLPENLIEIYPNPNSGSFVFKCKEDISFNIVNELGQIIESSTLSTDKIYESNELKNGIYFIQITVGSAIITKKIIVINN